MNSVLSIYLVWLRYFAVFKKNLAYGLVTTFVEPLLYLGSFGFGLGALVGPITIGNISVTYRAFVLAGIVAQSVLFQSFFEASYGGFIRMYYQKIFHAIAYTPVTLSEVLWGELIWNASRSTLSASVVLMLGVAIGDFDAVGALVLIPFCFLTSLMFSGMGLLVAAKSRTIDTISYPQYLLVFPMFLFCGVFFPITNLPEPIQTFASVLPLAPVVSIIRTLCLGFPFHIVDLVILAGFGLFFVIVSRRAMFNRLVK